MKRIAIDCFIGFNELDVYLIDTDLELDEGVRDLKEGLTYEDTKNYVEELISKYSLSSNDIIRICNFDEDKHLTVTKNLTVIMFKDLYIYN